MTADDGSLVLPGAAAQVRGLRSVRCVARRCTSRSYLGTD
jgi:hypothetical protein